MKIPGIMESLGAKETISQAAMRFKGKLYVGKNHSDIIEEILKANKIKESDNDYEFYNHLEDGFITSKGRFVDRNIANDLSGRKGKRGILSSEDMEDD